MLMTLSRAKADHHRSGQAIDDKTFEVTLSEPVPYFINSRSPIRFSGAESRHRKYGEKWTQPANIVTNGAYKLKDWVVNERTAWRRNPQYWDNAKPSLIRLPTCRFSEVTDVNRYRNGEIDI